MFFQSEQRLINKAKTGNKSAWFKLVSMHERMVYHYCLRMLGNQDDAVDLMQEVFISVYRSLDGFRFDSSFKTWLIRIAHRRCVEFYRKRTVYEQNDDIEQQLEASPRSCPEQSLQSKQHNQLVIVALQTLSNEQRLVIELKFFQHYTFEQIAEQLLVSTSTVKSRFYAGLSNLKPALEKYNDE